MNSTEFSFLKEAVESRFGLALKNYTRERLSRKLETRLKALRLKSFHDYHKLLLKEPFLNKELPHLFSLLTNKESYFLREKDQFAVFIRLLNRIKRKKIIKSLNTVRILSAGCAAGQEPYSIALAIMQSGTPLRSWDIQIYGIDIDPDALKEAKHGIFHQYSFRGTGEKIRENYFMQVKKDCYRITPGIMKHVIFLKGNLLDPAVFKELKDMDFIFCRNVLIYMSRRAGNTIAHNLWEALSDEGYLFLGHSESFRQQNILFKPLDFPEATVYQKQYPEILDKQKAGNF